MSEMARSVNSFSVFFYRQQCPHPSAIVPLAAVSTNHIEASSRFCLPLSNPTTTVRPPSDGRYRIQPTTSTSSSNTRVAHLLTLPLSNATISNDCFPPHVTAVKYSHIKTCSRLVFRCQIPSTFNDPSPLLPSLEGKGLSFLDSHVEHKLLLSHQTHFVLCKTIHGPSKGSTLPGIPSAQRTTAVACCSWT